MRHRVLGIAILLTLVAAPAALADNWSKTWNVSAPPRFHLVTGYGTVTIHQVEGNSARAVVNTDYWHIDPSEVGITESQSGNSIDVQIHTPEQHSSWFHWRSPRVEIEIDVPAHSNLDLETGFGDFTASGLQAKSRLDTGFGHVRLTDYDGSLDAESGFGDMTTDGRFDSLQLKTGFGHIDARVAQGSHVTDSWRVTSGFGDVRMKLPEDLNADLHASSGFGGVSTDFPITISGMKEHSSISGRIGSGGPPLNLETGFGSVHIGKI